MFKYSKIFLFFVMCLIYGVSVLYSSSQLLDDSEHIKIKNKHKLLSIFPRDIVKHKHEGPTIIDISGTAMYLWVNILGGVINYQKQQNSNWLHNDLKVENYKLKYYLGIGNHPNQTINTMKNGNLILAINGRSPSLKHFSVAWLKEIMQWNVTRFGIILLGDERCNNDWIYEFMNQNSRVNYAFILYDTKGDIYKNVYEWPLGVASYRNFGSFGSTLKNQSNRTYFANFIGTIYENSSRSRLQTTLTKYNENEKNGKKVLLKIRSQWPEIEESESSIQYKHILLNSHFTISPVGQNAECYRTYEAIELGSIPIIQDYVTMGNCSKESPYSFLKKYNPPIYFVKNWDTELPVLLKKLALLTDKEIFIMRDNLINWYEIFKVELKQYFLKHAISEL